MKGISHFVTGVTVASFFPWTVQAAMEGNPLYFVLGGFFGLLPDTLDFKFYRFFYKHDIYIQPDPKNPDPQQIADELARAIELANREKREIRVKLNTIRMGVDYWQQYIVKIDEKKQEVRVWFGPVVNTGQVPIPQKEEGKPVVAVAKISAPFHYSYESITTIDIFDGPSLSMKPGEDGQVTVYFLPWHRTWSHSLVTGLTCGLVGWWLWGWRAALVIPCAFTAHVIEDQYGHMGSNLFWPFTRKRFEGLKKMHATDALPNFLTVWICCLLIFWNLYRAVEQPLYHFNLLQLFLYGAVIPLGLFGLVHKWITRKQHIEEEEPDASDEWIEESLMG